MADGYQALYRRYRSKRFGELRGQEHVVRALRTAVAEGRVGHAYLFSGPRGTGKTSTARILAKVLNCEHPTDGEPDGTCANCVAVDDGRIVDWLLELDAASNNGVANIRELIERIPLGTSGNRKVVILDEVHMLSAGASNALLKSLEEPPPHVVFILCTTDPQRVLPTIRSRTQHFEFHLLEADELSEHVRFVIADAGLGLGEDAVEHVVRQGGGSARDTLSALDQVSAMGGVVEQSQPVEAILDALCAHDAGAALVAVADATAAGRDPRTLGEVLITRLRDAFLAVMKAPDRHLPTADLVKAEALGAQLGAAGLTRALEVLGDALVELGKKPDPRIVLEVALVRLCRPDADRSFDAILERLDRLERAGPASPASAPTDASADAGPRAAPPARGPADSAREELARAGGARPARAPVKKATAPPTSASPRTASAAAPASAVEAQPASEVDVDESGAPAPPAPPPGDLPTAADMQAAWPTVIDGLKGASKGMFRDARFEVAVDVVVCTVPPGPPVDQLERRWPEVEKAVAAHWGRPIPLRLAIGAAPSPAPAPDAPVEDEPIDVRELEDAPAGGTEVDRLAEAFPGAELVDE
ncbi:MAG: DNA polymerase III subunit gamma/tau [Acidimicrobiales bacterium]